jgi:hypothetical protein
VRVIYVIAPKVKPGVRDLGRARMVITLGSDYDTTRAAGFKARMDKIKGVTFMDFDYINNKVILEFNPDRVGPRELEVMVTQESKHRARSAAGQRPVRNSRRRNQSGSSNHVR